MPTKRTNRGIPCLCFIPAVAVPRTSRGWSSVAARCHIALVTVTFGLALGPLAAGGDLEGRFAGMGYEGDTPVISALCEILSLEQCCGGDVLSFTWYPASIADNDIGVVEMIQRGIVVVVEDDLHQSD